MLKELSKTEELNLENFYSDTPLMNFVIASNGKIKEINHQVIEELGYQKKELIGKNISGLFDKGDKEKIKRYLKKIVNNPDKKFIWELKKVKKNGEIIRVTAFSKIIKKNNRISDIYIFSKSNDKKGIDNQSKVQSHELLRQISELMPMPLVFATLEGEIKYLNGRFIEIFGYSREEIPNMSIWFDKAYPDKQYRKEVTVSWNESFETFIKKGENIPKRETIITCKDGSQKNIEIHYTIIDDIILAVFNDISSLRDSEKKLDEKRIFLRSILDLTPHHIFAKDIDGYYTIANRAVVDFFDVDYKQIIGKNVSDIFSDPKILKKFRNEDKEVIKTKKERVFLEHVNDKEGKEHIFETIIMPLLDEKKNVYNLLGIGTDVTEQKKSEKIQSSLYQISEATNSAKNLTDLFKSVHKIVKELMPANNFYIALLDDEGEKIYFPYFVDEKDSAPESRKLKRGMSEYVININKPLFATSDVIKDLRKKRKISVMGEIPVDWIGVPLMINKKAIGLIAVQSYNEKVNHTEEDKEILMFVSNQIAMAIERVRNRDEVARRSEEISTLYETTRDLVTKRDLSELLKTIINRARKMLSAPSGFIFFFNPFENDLELTIEIPDNKNVGVKYNIGEGAVGKVAETRKPLIINDYQNWNNKETEKIKGRSAAVLEVPMSYGDTFIGVLGIREFEGSKRKFTSDDVRQLSLFAAQATVAIHNANLFEKLENELTERIKIEQALLKRENELKELNASKDKFFSIISHDLKNPFVALLGLSKLIAEESGNLTMDELKSTSESLNNAADNLYKLLENLLEWSRVEGGLSELNPQPVNLFNTVEDVFLLFNSHAVSKKIKLINLVKKNIVVISDKNMFGTTMRNLISNAIKFSHKKSEVEVSAVKSSTGIVQIAVKDQGVGMDENTLLNIFRIDSKTSTKGTAGETSTGLGLPLCKELIERNKGKIWVNSEPGKGSDFIFTLPSVIKSQRTKK